MNKEDKSLLLKDLCARLPYKVKGVITYDESNTTFTVEGIDNNVLHLSDAEECYVEDFRVYLRPMDSMTEEEYAEYVRLVHEGYAHDTVDYLNSIHVDYRCLIQKGLAIKVTEENNPYET